jgi:hypothetical protein
MSTSERTEVIKMHRDRVIEYDLRKAKKREISELLMLHKRMDGHMKTALHAEQQSREKAKAKMVGRSRSVAARMMDIEESVYDGSKQAKNDEDSLRREAQRSYYFDYNTVETVLLGSAILVCLSGIMFENERFEERADLEYQKDIITYIVIAVVFFSVFYYCVVFVSEVFAWHPKWLLAVFASKKARTAAKLAQKIRERGESQGALDDDIVMHHDLSANPMGSKKTVLAATKSDLSASDMLRDGQLRDLNTLCNVQKDQIINLQNMLRRYKKDEEFLDSTSTSRPQTRKRTIGSKKIFAQTRTAVPKQVPEASRTGEMEMTDFGKTSADSAPSNEDNESGSMLKTMKVDAEDNESGSMLKTQNPLAAASFRTDTSYREAKTSYSPSPRSSHSRSRLRTNSSVEPHSSGRVSRTESDFQKDDQDGVDNLVAFDLL